MNEGSKFCLGNTDTPQSVRREVAALFRRDRGIDRDGPTPEVILPKRHPCGSGRGIRLSGGIFCRKCGRPA